MTFSRGGLVAGVAALGYVWAVTFWKVGLRGRHGVFRSPTFWLSIFLTLSLVSFAVWSGLVDRSVEALGEDASVTNRVDLWKAGLQMAFENPTGFGSGQSGTEFMQWYQPTDKTEGYRTMVNSYLTFLVEQGWMVFMGCIALLILFWRWSDLRDTNWRMIAALKASILSFLVAGVFSTTMEDFWLWIIPLACVAVIAAKIRKRPKWKPILLSSFGITLVLLGTLLGIGWICSSKDPIVRRFESCDGVRKVVGVSCRDPKAVIALLPDSAVMGEQYGKLARTLALNTGASVVIDAPANADLVLASGEKCLAGSINKPTIWIAPPVPIQGLSPHFMDPGPLVFVPEIDEDGRTEWWKRQSAIQIIPLEGVGTRVDWAWDTVVGIIKEQLASRASPSVSK